MNRAFLIICIFQLIIVSAYAKEVEKSNTNVVNKQRNIYVTPSVGYRYDVFQWSIPGEDVAKL